MWLMANLYMLRVSHEFPSIYILQMYFLHKNRKAKGKHTLPDPHTDDPGVKP